MIMTMKKKDLADVDGRRLKFWYKMKIWMLIIEIETLNKNLNFDKKN